MLETIIIALLGVACIVGAYYITSLENQIEDYERLYYLRVEHTETENKYKNGKLDELTYYFNLKQIDEEIKEIENEINE